MFYSCHHDLVCSLTSIPTCHRLHIYDCRFRSARALSWFSDDLQPGETYGSQLVQCRLCVYTLCLYPHVHVNVRVGGKQLYSYSYIKSRDKIFNFTISFHLHLFLHCAAVLINQKFINKQLRMNIKNKKILHWV